MRLKAIRDMDSGELMRAVMFAFTASFLIAGLLSPDLRQMLPGLRRICTSPALLTKDYFAPQLGSVSGAMLNAALVGTVCCALTLLPGAKVDGGTVLAYSLTVGFCCYGINILNILPLMLGVFVYSRIRREPFARFTNVTMFATGVSPLITHLLFYYPAAGESPRFTVLGLLLALVTGVAFGCAMPAVCEHAKSFHKGYNLFNAGPAMGFLSILFFAVLHKTAGVEAMPIEVILGEGHRVFVNAFYIITFGLCAICGAIVNGGFKGYAQVFLDSGYKSDFTAKYAPGLNLMHMGLYGLFLLLCFNLIGASFTGPTMGAMFSMACCCCLGATPLNALPIVLGYVAMGLLNMAGLTAFPINAQGMVVGLCFAGGLAPISGEYGFAAGVVAGMLHYCLVTSIPAMHGGFNLYNGGFTSGIVCFVYVPILERFFKRRPFRNPR